MTIHVGKTVIEESDEETLLGIMLDTMLCFKLFSFSKFLSIVVSRHKINILN